jgi:formylglycine-generating enzyme required for sulfatase activity
MKTKFHCYLSTALALFAGIHPALAQSPDLSIALAGRQVVLSWPTTATNFVLQSTTNLSPAAWSTNSPAPVVVNGQNTVTNAISGTHQFYRLSLLIPPGMAFIPAGSFTMGNSIGDSDITDANPTNVYVSAFYMDVNLVSYSQWQSVYNWATNTGYVFSPGAGLGRAANQPVEAVDWYDTVKWCNARSQQTGLTPVYYTDTNLTQVYTNGELTNLYVNWTASGYRLPTEAEWEKAARGGLSGQRFPWGDTISESQANYYGCIGCNFDGLAQNYDLGPNGYNTNFDTGWPNNPVYPFTSPMGYFAPNGYGLYDMTGNESVWCWDWYGGPPYPTGSPYLGGSNPQGPASGSARVYRGGNWGSSAYLARCANRNYISPSAGDNDAIGFRCVQGL